MPELTHAARPATVTVQATDEHGEVRAVAIAGGRSHLARRGLQGLGRWLDACASVMAGDGIQGWPILRIGGVVHLPFSASAFGQYTRVVVKNGPAGAGSQFDSLSGPGDSCCT